MSKRPNLVYVFADQLRYDALGCTGQRQAVTPNIDRFAAQGLSLVNTVSNTPVCTAYRATLMTGKYTTSHAMVINEIRMNPHQRCLGHVLTDGGYRTAYIGKWHLYANEFGNHYDSKNSFVPRGEHRLGFDGEWLAYNFHHENYSPKAYSHRESPEKVFCAPGEYEPTMQTDSAIDFLRRASTSSDASPFALVVSYGPPHDPWGSDNVPERFWRMFEGKHFPNPENYQPNDDVPYADGWARFRPGQRDELESWRRGYHAQVASLDAEVGRLLSAIDEAGLADDTIVVFTSDHGEMFGAHGRRAKLIFYEEAIRVPFLIRWPGHIAPGASDDACFSTVDILPTLCGLLDLDHPAEAEGTDISRAVLGLGGPTPEAAFLQGCGATAIWEDGHEWRAIRDKRFTYAIYRVDGRELLFDNIADPHQMTDLSADPGHAADKDRLRITMAARMAALNDGFEASTYYRDHWADADRKIQRSATGDFPPQ